jgi:hypothetical protein
MQSRIYETEKMFNEGRKFGADPCYYPALLVLPNGDETAVFFTNEQINTARHRGSINVDEALEYLEACHKHEKKVALLAIGAIVVASGLLAGVFVAVFS